MDIDIDFKNRDDLLKIIQNIPAAIKNNQGEIKKHNTGVYFQKIPINPLTDTASIDYKEAESRGYFKIDILNVGIYQDVRDEEHLIDLMNTEPMWDLLLEKDFVDNLFHLKGHHEILKIMKPTSIEQLAMVLAMIRPAKKYLIGKEWNKVIEEIWEPVSNGEYAFKKSHSFSYAAAVVVHMNLLCEKLENSR
jgi:DNA polymerase III alpha subunit